MNSVANENQFSGKKVAPGTGIDPLPGTKVPQRLEVSWHVASAQKVAILNSSEKPGDSELPPGACAGPAPIAARAKAA